MCCFRYCYIVCVFGSFDVFFFFNAICCVLVLEGVYFLLVCRLISMYTFVFGIASVWCCVVFVCGLLCVWSPSLLEGGLFVYYRFIRCLSALVLLLLCCFVVSAMCYELLCACYV